MSMSSRAAATAASSTSPFHLIGAAWTRAFRCVWMLEELGIPYQILDNVPGSDQVKKYNPSGKVPVLLEYDNNSNNKDDPPLFILTESTAINTYLGDVCFPDSGLVPKSGTRDRARYDSTISFISNELDSQALWAYRKHVAMGQHFGYVPEMQDIARAHFEKCNAIVAQQLLPVDNNSNISTSSSSLLGGPYLMGQHFTAADILYIHCLDWAKGLKWHTTWPNHLTTYRQLCQGRPAYQRTKALRDEQQQKQQQKKMKNKTNSRL